MLSVELGLITNDSVLLSLAVCGICAPLAAIARHKACSVGSTACCQSTVGVLPQIPSHLLMTIRWWEMGWEEGKTGWGGEGMGAERQQEEVDSVTRAGS